MTAEDLFHRYARKLLHINNNLNLYLHYLHHFIQI